MSLNIISSERIFMDLENDDLIPLSQIVTPRHCKQCGASLSKYNPTDRCFSHGTQFFRESVVNEPVSKEPKEERLIIDSKEEPIEAVIERLRRRGLITEGIE